MQMPRDQVDQQASSALIIGRWREQESRPHVQVKTGLVTKEAARWCWRAWKRAKRRGERGDVKQVYWKAWTRYHIHRRTFDRWILHIIRGRYNIGAGRFLVGRRQMKRYKHKRPG